MIEKLYKYWIFYKDNEIYAYTDSKEYAKRFMEERNMKLFQKKKVKISSYEVNQLAEFYQTAWLKESELPVYDNVNLSWSDETFVITEMEEITITNVSAQLMNADIFRWCWFNPYPFNDKLIAALKTLHYDRINRVVTSATASGTLDADYGDNFQIEPDMLGIFIHYYGKTLKG